MAGLKASSSSSGFFQALPKVPPQYSSPEPNSQNKHEASDDAVLSRVLSIYLPSPLPQHIQSHLHNFSRLVLSPSTLQYTVDCDTDLPTIHQLTTFGEENKVAPLRTSEGWRMLKLIETKAGVVGYGYPQSGIPLEFNRRVHQYATLHLWHGSAAVATCPMAMTDGAAALLRRHIDDSDGDQPGRAKVLRDSYSRLVSLDPETSWTSGQWMTERTGGSDVRGTETVARRLTQSELDADSVARRDKDAHGQPLGPWTVDGFKWFSSATDADMAVLLAQTDKGLSAFYAPLRRQTGLSPSTAPSTLTTQASDVPTEMNGVRIQRLKNKLGTKGVPTAELELKGMRAYLIGTQGQGIKEISSILNITRLHTAGGGTGTLARALAVSRAYTQVRKVKGTFLSENPQHLAWMAGETVKYHANAHLLFLGVALLGASEQSQPAVASNTPSATIIPQDATAVANLLRLLTPVAKAQCSLNAVSGVRACMESLGGVGYCENNEDGGVMNLARLLRDTTVNPIWEGTTSVMAEDVLRVVKNPRVKNKNVLDDVLGTWLRTVLAAVSSDLFKIELDIVQTRYRALNELVRDTDSVQLHWRGREVLDHIEAVVSAALLMFDATLDQDEIAVAVARRYVKSIALPRHKLYSDRNFDFAAEVRLDRLIFLGRSSSAADASLVASLQAKL
ncbi:hypothetical protein PV10_06253 [Exophiala mesophila]|uniref:Acyl-CoA dehydrogenase/oxidase C-terminal domain-containing protein n=1 Tax=Exophiala mesophila TaxID=212818 RepID=A0A0D1XU73_EXOME|nr:uncharacterized protein PV10_06253 [Exophiala mesophila]KIV91746.1 hypothetical protein PV10_06253 [Exophiala mesophila]